MYISRGFTAGEFQADISGIDNQVATGQYVLRNTAADILITEVGINDRHYHGITVVLLAANHRDDTFFHTQGGITVAVVDQQAIVTRGNVLAGGQTLAKTEHAVLVSGGG